MFRNFGRLLQFSTLQMVQAMKGVLLQGDVTMIEYVKSVNRGLPQNEKFIIADLDDKTLLLQPEAQELIQTKVEEWQLENQFQPHR